MNKNITLGIVVVFLAVFAYYFWKTPDTEVKPVVSADNAQICAQQSNASFNTITLSDTKNLLDIKTQSYTNHFNPKEGKCFMLVRASNNSGTSRTNLYDVYENKVIAGSLVSSNVTDPGSSTRYCYGESVGALSGAAACTEFQALVNAKMESSMY